MTKREILKLNGYRPALGGWSCADCKWSYRGSTHIYCSHRQNASAGVARDSVCDLFSPSRRTSSPVSDFRPGSTPALPRNPVEYADAQYHGRSDDRW